MKKKYIWAGSVILLAGVAAMYAFKVNAEKNSGVAAKVNGEVISIEEIRKGYTDNPQIAAQVPFNEFYAKAVDVFVNGKLLYQAAQKADIENTTEYKDQLKTMKEDLARKVYLEKAVEKSVTEDAVKKFYDEEYLKKFVSKKEMGAKHILLDNEKTAKEVIEKLKDGANFDKIAKEYTKDKTVDLGYFTEDLMVPEFVKAAKALKKGEYTKTPVKTQFGYHVILLQDVRDSSPLPLKDVEPQIKNLLGQKAIAETFDSLYKNGKVEKFDLNGALIPQAETK